MGEVVPLGREPFEGETCSCPGCERRPAWIMDRGGRSGLYRLCDEHAAPRRDGPGSEQWEAECDEFGCHEDGPEYGSDATGTTPQTPRR